MTLCISVLFLHAGTPRFSLSLPLNTSMAATGGRVEQTAPSGSSSEFTKLALLIAFPQVERIVYLRGLQSEIHGFHTKFPVQSKVILIRGRFDPVRV